jgi:hypothetical protein
MSNFLIEFPDLSYWKIQQLDARSVKTTSGGRGQSDPLAYSARTSVRAACRSAVAANRKSRNTVRQQKGREDGRTGEDGRKVEEGKGEDEREKEILKYYSEA